MFPTVPDFCPHHSTESAFTREDSVVVPSAGSRARSCPDLLLSVCISPFGGGHCSSLTLWAHLDAVCNCSVWLPPCDSHRGAGIALGFLGQSFVSPGFQCHAYAGGSLTHGSSLASLCPFSPCPLNNSM